MSWRATDVSRMQERAWSYYGWPGGSCRAVGEVRYVVGWHADQMTRLDWDVTINDETDWTVTLPDGESITTRTGDVDDAGEPVSDVTAASRRLLDLIGWDDQNVRAVDTNLFVGGQGWYVEDGDDWTVVSVVDPDRKKKTRDGGVPFWWPHPADPDKPDAPLFSVLDLLDELDWLNRQARTQSRQRVLTSGIVAVGDGFQGPNGTDFWEEWNTALSARMADPDDLSPVRLSGPNDMVKDGINWLVPPFGYDQVIDRRVLAAIHRLAYGLPIPPEILLGMQAQSRATAFQVEENAYRAHIEPPALMVAQVAEDALAVLLPDVVVRVTPNPARLLARRNSVQDVKDAYDRGLADGPYVREILGIPEDAKPNVVVEQSQAVTLAVELVKGNPSLARDPGIDVVAEQIGRLLEGQAVPSLNDAVADAEQDPANQAADEPVTGAAATPHDDLSQLLSDIDFHLTSELAGVTVMATDRARQRLGAKARRDDTVRNNPELKGFTSSQLAVHLGADGLAAAGVDVGDQIGEPVDSATRWWVRRVGEAWTQAAELVPGWSGQGEWIEASVQLLAEALTAHIVDTLGVLEPPPLDAAGLRGVLDAASGGSGGVR